VFSAAVRAGALQGSPLPYNKEKPRRHAAAFDLLSAELVRPDVKIGSFVSLAEATDGG
jgi:hypothetical protein